MMESTYKWKRYWVPRDGGFSFDHEGFLLPPGGDNSWAGSWKSDIVDFDEMLSKPCLALLGEPGIGKSYAIRDAERRARAIKCGASATMLFCDLKAYSTDSLLVDGVFKSPEFSSWHRLGGEFHVFLDSFDECLLRVDSVANLLAERFAQISCVKNLFLRIASRTAEWRTSLEDALRQKWDEDSVGVYELAPLTRDQVLEAATVHLPEPERFVAEIVASELVSFAIKPLTLDLLIRIWKKQGGSLPPSQRAIYEQGCLELCTDPEERQTPKLCGKHSPEERMTVASHIAAATFFCNRTAIWTAPRQAQKPEADISLAELATGSVTVKGQRLEVKESALKEALNTGLFTLRGRNRLGWAHQTYGEFLAARYLEKEGLSEKQKFDLLTHPHDPQRRLVPQLQETAAWVATPGSELFTHLARVQPDVLLRSDVATADECHKSTLVEALINAFARDSIRGGDRGMYKRLRKLRHQGLAGQLRRHLLDHTLVVGARTKVISIVEACEIAELLPDLAELALNCGEPQAIREMAAAVVGRCEDKKSKERLRPLALGNAGHDPDHELRGAGLIACWPGYLTSDELFSSLVAPKERDFGFYHLFLLHHLVDKLTMTDLSSALAWAESQPESRGLLYGYSDLIPRILDRAAEFIGEKAILPALAKALLSRLRKHDFSHGWSLPALAKVLESRPDLRLELVEVMLPFFEDISHDTIKITRWGLRLLFPQDIPWLIECLQNAASPEAQKRYAHLLKNVFYPDDAEQTKAVIEASERSSVLFDVMSYWIKPWSIDSDEAQKARKFYIDEQRHRKELERQRKSKLLSPPPAERLIQMLDLCEAGDGEAWWKLQIWLQVQEDGCWCKKYRHMDIRQLAGWQEAADVTKARMVAAAERYLYARGAAPEEWFSQRNILHYPAVAGFRALLLLANENPAAFEALPRDVWQRWMPAIFRLHYYDERYEHRLLTAKAFDRAPENAADWTIRVVNEENKEGENLWVLQKLPEKWDDGFGTALSEQIRQRKLKPQCFNQLLTALLGHHVLGALDFTRSQVSFRVPKSAKRRQSALHAARLLMIYGEQGDWPRVWNLIKKNAGFGKDLIQGFGHDYGHSPAGIMKTLLEADVSALWEWMLAQYPVAEDPDRSRGGDVTTRYAMANLRDSLISHLANVGTTTACNELQRLIDKYPQFDWFRRMLLLGQEQVRRLTWKPVSPGNFFQLAANRRARLVQSGDQLLEVILDSLRVLQERLQGETPTAQFLWNDKRPKSEAAISDWVKIHLEDDLKQRGVVLGREVQIHISQRTDIHVTAVTQCGQDQPFDNLEVIIEVKGSWNRELKTAMETQLAERYLNNTLCRHGLYLVAWFSTETPGGKKELHPGISGRQTLEDHLVRQAQQLSSEARTIKARVIDFSMKHPSSNRRVSIQSAAHGNLHQRPL